MSIRHTGKQTDCPCGTCPGSRHDDVDRASFFGCGIHIFTPFRMMSAENDEFLREFEKKGLQISEISGIIRNVLI